jgi:hypothetical protein
MAVEVEIDVEVLKCEIKKTYASPLSPRKSSSSRPASAGAAPWLRADRDR